MANSDNNKKSLWLIILLILSLGLNGYFFYSIKKGTEENAKLSQEIKDLSATVDSFVVISSGLTAELGSTATELEEFRGLSSELDSLLNDAKKDIATKQAKINRLYGDVSKKKELEKTVAELQALKDRYLERIDSLVQTNNLLQTQVVEYQKNVEELGAKVQQGSILNAGNINTTSYKQKKSGKYAPTIVSSKTKRLEICFDLMQNKISGEGEKTVFVKVIGPDGVTLGTDASGGGTFTSNDDQTEQRYTASKTITYENQKKNYCVNWEQDLAFSGGNYQVEVYVDNYFSGVGAFILK